MLCPFPSTILKRKFFACLLRLPPEDRARLLELLIASLKSESQEAWLRLALIRQEAVRSGKVAMVPGDEALARVRARIV